MKFGTILNKTLQSINLYRNKGFKIYSLARFLIFQIKKQLIVFTKTHFKPNNFFTVSSKLLKIVIEFIYFISLHYNLNGIIFKPQYLPLRDPAELPKAAG